MAKKVVVVLRVVLVLVGAGGEVDTPMHTM